MGPGGPRAARTRPPGPPCRLGRSRRPRRCPPGGAGRGGAGGAGHGHSAPLGSARPRSAPRGRGSPEPAPGKRRSAEPGAERGAAAAEGKTRGRSAGTAPDYEGGTESDVGPKFLALSAAGPRHCGQPAGEARRARARPRGAAGGKDGKIHLLHRQRGRVTGDRSLATHGRDAGWEHRSF